eukprot:maker-scaffold_37-snap-gene-1.50-mRNA-1 protein AED:0.02 eAED:0.02 QI:758/0/1/1/0/0/2/29/134
MIMVFCSQVLSAEQSANTISFVSGDFRSAIYDSISSQIVSGNFWEISFNEEFVDFRVENSSSSFVVKEEDDLGRRTPEESAIAVSSAPEAIAYLDNTLPTLPKPNTANFIFLLFPILSLFWSLNDVALRGFVPW